MLIIYIGSFAPFSLPAPWCINIKTIICNNSKKLEENKKKFFMAISEALTWNGNYAKEKSLSMWKAGKRKRKKNCFAIHSCRANNFQFTPLTLKRSSAFSFQLSKTLAKIEGGCWGKRNKKCTWSGEKKVRKTFLILFILQ